MSEERFVGTRVGGDPASLLELELWLRNTLGAAVEDAAEELKELHSGLFDIWYDWAAISFETTLKLGRDDTFELADRIGKVAELVGGCAGALRSSQARLDDVEARAQGEPLAVLEGKIFSPVGWPYDSQAEEPADPELYQQQVESFFALADQADEAMRPVAENMQRIATSGVWTAALFKAGSIVHAETSVLARHYESKHTHLLDGLGPQGAGTELAERSRTILDRVGIVKRALGPVGHIISGSDAYMSLREGERPGRVLVEFGVSSATGAAGVGVAALALAVGGSAFLVGGGVIIGAIMIIAADDVGDVGGSIYDNVVPPTPRQLLLEHADSADYAAEGSIRW